MLSYFLLIRTVESIGLIYIILPNQNTKIPNNFSGQSDSQHQYFNHPHQQQQQQQIYQQQNQIQQFQNYQKQQQQQQQSGPVQYQPEVIRINQVTFKNDLS